LEFRWSAWFQRSSEAIFVLSRRRQILFVNRAWEALTSLSYTEVHRRLCKGQRDALPGSCEALLHALRPPREALEGEVVCVRRMVAGPGESLRWWDVGFWPLHGSEGLLGVLGKIRVADVPSGSGLQALPEKLMALRERESAGWRLENLTSELPAMSLVREQVRLASKSGAAVLLVGESGTGKHWLARTIHSYGERRENTFCSLDCSKLPLAALAHALFGGPGLAHRSDVTLYLREPGVLPRELQARLCQDVGLGREEGRSPQLLSGCAVDPLASVAAGQLLPELHALLAPLTIRLPPLRERRCDLPALARSFLQRFSESADKPAPDISQDAMELLLAHGWPGNLTELFTVLASADQRAKDSMIAVSHLPLYLRSPGVLPDRPLPLDSLLEQVERRLIQVALATAKGNKSKAAEMLAVWRPRLLRRIEALGIQGASE
jgi:DNA-binding NtrC family response regulator